MPLATRFRGSAGEVSRSEARIGHSNASMLSVGSKLFWSGSKPYSGSPPSLDDEMTGKQSLYDELLPHISDLSSDDDLASEFPRANHTSGLKRPRSSSTSYSSSPPLQPEDTKRQRTGYTVSGVAVEMAEMTIRTSAQKVDTDKRAEWESE